MGHTDRNIKNVFINILFLIVLIILLLVPGYLCYKVFFLDTKEIEEDTITKQVPVEDVKSEEENQVIEKVEPYKEFFPILEDQQAYVVVPGKIDTKNPPVLIVYSHGSNTVVSQNMSDQFMIDMQEYGKYFTQYNYIFSASNQHGVNWGNNASLRDITNLREWVVQNYDVQPKIYMIGFSMGGLPTLNYATENGEVIGKIALLAPTIRIKEWNQERVDKIMDIDIKIWHGNADVNVPYNYSVSLVNKLKSYGKEVEFITIERKGHFDIDTEYMGDILEFFNQ